MSGYKTRIYTRFIKQKPKQLPDEIEHLTFQASRVQRSLKCTSLSCSKCNEVLGDNRMRGYKSISINNYLILKPLRNRNNGCALFFFFLSHISGIQHSR